MSLFKLKRQAESYAKDLRKYGTRSKITKTSKPTYKWLVEELRKFAGSDFFLRGTYANKRIAKSNVDKYKKEGYHTRVTPKKIYGKINYQLWLRKK